MRRLKVWGLLAALVLAGVQAAAADDLPLPARLSFKVRKGALLSGRFLLSCAEDWNTPDAYLLTLSDFVSLGYSSNQRLMSTVKKKDLSLAGHVVLDGERVVRRVFLDENCKSAIDREKTKCFKYQEGPDGTALQTEIFTPHRAIDLISSILVATQAAGEKGFEHRDFNFIFNNKTRQVRLIVRGTEELETPLGRLKTKVLALEHTESGVELYRFYVASDRRGGIPVRMIYEDDKEGTIEFLVDNVEWDG